MLPTSMPATTSAHHPSGDYGQEAKVTRAILILANYQLLIKYANLNQKSIPRTRYYFEQVAVGAEPDPIIQNWFGNDK
ncbi:uncharacterized protein HMPREF1541_09942 [Cyphellophora europaea CBS 101466]|uniref:Uncharacterized protein n=1 Tax=Cyphellophora europaea (strain CBS 101466) TaxID=1220924 RepID=W2S8L7_CYPE1|nr:uncharacterized protein HMPREF1541_09942 [Cyphellophora europaea CBS 101466]ETN45066.1 hypothetical protein HMPREF1541_09942 [Cyphellophora europaea CBS 101466]